VVASLIHDSVQVNITRADDKPIKFEVSVNENLPAKLIGDQLRIRQVLNNLLSNAFKYTDEGVVTLSVDYEPSYTEYGQYNNGITLVFRIQDSGHGMTKEQLKKLFVEYSRFNQQNGKIIEGTGLGLAITQRIIDLMHGSIHVESTPGAGSLFIVKLPQEKVDKELLGFETAENLRKFQSSGNEYSKHNRVFRTPMPYGKVLIVDDVEMNIHVASGLMGLYSLQVDTAMSGFDAIAKIKSGLKYDIVFMDHMMPEMDGIEATHQLRSLGYTSPIVALTANAVVGQSRMFLQNGFDDFISKPIEMQQLNAVLNRLIRDKHSKDAEASAIDVEALQNDDLTAAKKDEAKSDDEKKGSLPTIAPDFLASVKKIDGINTERGLAYTNGNEEMYRSTLAIFHKNLLASCDEMKDFLDADDIKNFSISVHGVKTMLNTIGAEKLSEKALELEKASKKGDLRYCSETFQFFYHRLFMLHTKLSEIFT